MKGKGKAQTVQPSHSRALPETDPALAALQGQPELAQARQQDQELQREKGKEQSKPPVPRDKTLLQAKGFIEQQPEELQRNLKLNKHIVRKN